MKQQQVGRWAHKRVLTHSLTGMLSPSRAKTILTPVYRVLKGRAARLPVTTLTEIFPGIDQAEIRIKYSPKAGGGSLSDLLTLTQVASFLGRRRMFEVGTYRGYTTYHLALNSPSDAHVYTLDLPASQIPAAALELTDLAYIDKPVSGEWFHDTECEPKIAQLLGDSATFDYSPYEGKMDFIYIDGSHSYEYAMADSLTARRLLAPGGVIMWHDYPTFPGVWACLEELSKQWPGRFSWIDGTALVLWRQDEQQHRSR
jgi:predicted O-methyltransferase YrrM